MKCGILTVGISALTLLLSGAGNSAWASVRLGITVTQAQRGLGIDTVDPDGLADQLQLTTGDLIWTVRGVDRFGNVWQARATSVPAILPVLDNTETRIDVFYRRAGVWYRTSGEFLPHGGVRCTTTKLPATWNPGR